MNEIMGIKATEMKKGMVVTVDGNPCMVMDYQHVKLGKGGAVLQTKLKNMLDGTITTKRIRSEETMNTYIAAGMSMCLCTRRRSIKSA